MVTDRLRIKRLSLEENARVIMKKWLLYLAESGDYIEAAGSSV